MCWNLSHFSDTGSGCLLKDHIYLIHFQQQVGLSTSAPVMAGVEPISASVCVGGGLVRSCFKESGAQFVANQKLTSGNRCAAGLVLDGPHLTSVSTSSPSQLCHVHLPLYL